jgi:hypothetical protein
MAAAPADWATSAAGKAAAYGWSLAVINSNSELKSLFGKASAQNWTPDEFVARVRDTSWFKTHADTYRQALILKKADPATYTARQNAQTASVSSIAIQMGAHMSPHLLSIMGETALLYNWNADQIKQHLVSLVGTMGGQYTGAAGTEQQQYKQIAGDYGISMSGAQLSSFIRGAALGSVNQQTVQNWAIAQAQSRYPALAQRLQAGETLKQIADPYIQSQAKIFETNPNTINLTDASIQKALASKDAKGAPTTMSVWQYEQGLRQDPRFLKTQAAQDTGMQMAHSVLKDFGLTS